MSCLCISDISVLMSFSGSLIVGIYALIIPIMLAIKTNYHETILGKGFGVILMIFFASLIVYNTKL